MSEQFRPAFIWFQLHQHAEVWAQNIQNGMDPEDLTYNDDEDALLFRSLDDFAVQRWIKLCEALEWTVYGAVALSWCKDADLSQVWEGWEASGFPLKPLSEYERPARFINPALLPATNSLLELARIVENKTLPICAMIVAKGDALDVDLTPGQATNASPQIAAFLKAHMERKQNRTDEQNQMIEVWSGIISGTQWEM